MQTEQCGAKFWKHCCTLPKGHDGWHAEQPPQMPLSWFAGWRMPQADSYRLWDDTGRGVTRGDL